MVHFRILAGLCSWLLFASVAQAQNLLSNAGFDTPSSGLLAPNYSTTYTGSGAGGDSPAASWNSFNNSYGPTTSELLTSNDPNGSGYMLHVTTNGIWNGVYQYFSGATNQATLSVDVKVSSGQVWLALYSGGTNALSSVVSTTTGTWETLTIPLAGYALTPNYFVLYSSPNSSGFNEFYADNTYAGISAAVPEPEAYAMLLAGIGLLGFIVRRRKSNSLQTEVVRDIHRGRCQDSGSVLQGEA